MKKIITGIKKAIRNIWVWIKIVMKIIWYLIKIIAEWIWIFIKKVWLGTVGVALWLSASFIIYKQTDLLISDKIQAWAIVTLVFVTVFYAIQTQRLVKQEKISLKDQREKRYADYGEKILQNFFFPWAFKLKDLKPLIERISGLNELDDKIKPAIDIINEITGLMVKYGYLATREMLEFIKNMQDALNIIVDISHGEEDTFKKWKEELISLIEKQGKDLGERCKFYLERIENVYKIQR